LKTFELTKDRYVTIVVSYTEEEQTLSVDKRVRVRNVTLPPAPVLTSLSINGPSRLPESELARFQCLAVFDDETQQDVTASATWRIEKVAGNYIELGQIPGEVQTNAVEVDHPAVIRASYSSGAVTLSANKNVTIVDADLNIGLGTIPTCTSLGLAAIGLLLLGSWSISSRRS